MTDLCVLDRPFSELAAGLGVNPCGARPIGSKAAETLGALADHYDEVDRRRRTRRTLGTKAAALGRFEPKDD